MRHRKLNQQGFTLIELLVVVAIIGVLAAIAIVNYMVALDKSKQKATMTDMRSIANAWEARATDKGAYNAAGAMAFAWPSEQLTFNDMTALLSPTYIRPLAKYDSWGNAYQFAIDAPNGSATNASVYAIRSPGRGNVFDGDTYTEGTTTRFDCDIVFSNGMFVVLPATK